MLDKFQGHSRNGMAFFIGLTEYLRKHITVLNFEIIQ